MMRTLAFGLAALALTSSPTALPGQPPVAREVVDTLHGVPVSDPFRWLEDHQSAAVRRWAHGRDSIARDALERLPSHQRFLDRLRELSGMERLQAPVRAGGKLFYRVADVTGTARVMLAVRECDECQARTLVHPDSLGAPDLVLASGSATGVLFEPSPDGRLLVYGTSERGSNWVTLRIRDVASGSVLGDSLSGVQAGVAIAWEANGAAFYYTRYHGPVVDPSAPPGRQAVYRHRVGTPQSLDDLVLERPDESRARFHPAVSHDGRWLVVAVSTGAGRSNRVLVRDLASARGAMRELIADSSASFAFAGVDDSHFLFLTTLGAARGRVIALPTTGGSRIETRVPESSVTLTAVQIAGGRLLVQYVDDAYPRVAIHSLAGQRERDLEVPEGLIAWSGYRGAPDSPEVLASLSGIADPGTLHAFDVVTGKGRILVRPRLPYDPDAFVTRRVFFRSRDGTRVPMYLVHRKDLTTATPSPTWLYGYGAFNFSAFPWFQVQLIPWIEAGGVYALAGIRGGGEYGAAWRAAGTRANRVNAVDDFIGAAEWLVSSGVATPATLVVNGQSASGPLAGAAVVRRPELFAAALLEIPLADMVRFDRFPGGTGWYREFGDPRDETEFRALHAYSPYHQLQRGGCYPPVLITAGGKDPTASPAHAYKLAAVLERSQQCTERPTHLRVAWEAGHAMGATVDDAIGGWAAQLAFAVTHAGQRAGRRAPSTARDSVEIVYLANMGVLLRSPGTSVLVDALFGAGLPGYGVVSRSTLASLQRLSAPFDSVRYVLVTHHHRDHFDAGAVLDYLRVNRLATLVAPAEVVSRLHAADSSATRAVLSQLVAVNPPRGARERVVTGPGVVIEALGMPHGPTSNAAVNVGYLVEMNGRRLVHIGDTTIGAEDLAVFGFRSPGIDTALLPYWYLLDPSLQRAVREGIDPRSIVVLHAPAAGHESPVVRSRGGWAALAREIQLSFPNAVVPSREQERLPRAP